MTVLTIPPLRAEDVQPAKDFLFAVYGESRWTEENYLAMSDRTNHIIEFSEGRLIVPAMPTPKHQDIVLLLALLVRSWALKHGGRAFVSPMPVRLWPGKFREPDVFLYTAAHRDRVSEQYGGVPDLAIEVLSPSTEKTDTDEKMGEYAQAGVPEYWVVSVDDVHVEQYVLDGAQYRLHAALSAGNTVRAVTLTDLEIAVDELYASN
jgi:Uma2 family endonuclease